MKVLVIGDRCFDIFKYGSVDKICPEAPVAVFQETKQKDLSAGMAGNVLGNLKGLRPDWEFGHYFSSTAVTKTRYVDAISNYILLRVDDDAGIGEASAVDLAETLKNFNGARGEGPDAVVISDYNKGFLTESFISFVITTFSCPVFLDTKKTLGDWSYGVDFVKINQKEFNDNAAQLSPLGHPKDYCNTLIVTKGGDGAEIYEGNDITEYASEGGEIFDVSGAGDSFLAGLVVKYLETKDIAEAMVFANKVAAKAVSKKGVVQVKQDWLEDE